MPSNAAASSLHPGFADPVAEAQASFRALLEAMARPGRIQQIQAALEPPPGVDPASAALLLTLLDHDTPLWLDRAEGNEAAARFFTFHCGCPMATKPEAARFALVASDHDGLDRFALGTAERPELSATIIVQLPALTGGDAVRLSGPGIDGHVSLAPQGTDGAFWEAVRRNAALFPRGVDIVLVSGRALCGLPRTTRMET